MSKKNTKIKRFVWPFPKGNGIRGTNDKFLRIIIDYDKLEVYRHNTKDNWHESDNVKFNSLTQEELINYFPKQKKAKPKKKAKSTPASKLESKLERKQKKEIINKTIFNDCESLLE